MVRTRADNCARKAVASKAPRKVFNSGAGGSGSSSSYDSPSRNHPGAPLVNHARMWPTPKWQKGIGSFFSKIGDGDSSRSSSEANSPSNDRMDTNDVLADNNPCENDEITAEKLSSPVLNTIENGGETESCKSESRSNSSSPCDPTNEPCGSGLSSSSKQKKRNGKSKVLNSNRKRRVVIDDSSDDE